MEPIAIRVFCGERGLDLIVVANLARLDVDQEHPARLQPALGDDDRWIDVDDAGFAGQNDQVIRGSPPPSGTQPVAVEHSADHGAIGEGHAGRTIPRLHERGMKCVEVAASLVHRRRVLPRLRDHHQHGMR